MPIDQKTKSFLTNNLKFSSVQVDRLENNSAMLSKILGLLETYRKSPKSRETKLFTLRQIKSIKQSLDESSQPETQVLVKARSEYYSFQKPKKLSFLQPA
ncbi:hypothetical protein KJ966_26560 [bacterium]|nr:hypothetical protein [bacterium]